MQPEESKPPGERCRPRLPSLNGGAQDTGGLGGKDGGRHTGSPSSRPVGLKWGHWQYLGTFWAVSAGVGTRVPLHLAGRGTLLDISRCTGCPPPHSAPPKREQCQVQRPRQAMPQPCPATSPRPRGCRGSHTSPTPKSKQSHPESPLRDGVEGWGGEGERDHSGGPEQGRSLRPPPTSAKEKSQTRAIFGQTGKRKAELKGQPLDPTCPAAAVGQSLCTEVHVHEQTRRPGSRAAGRENGQDRQVAARRREPGRGGPHLFSIRVCTLYTRSRASFRICLVLCRSAISEREGNRL